MLPDCPQLCGAPTARAELKAANSDFQVEEIFHAEFSDDGEFDWLWVEKDGQNSDWLARALARFAGVAPAAVTYAGLKDRHALTRQWFCVHLPGKRRVDWSTLDVPGARLLDYRRHRQKLRRGAHSGNRFVIVLRNVQGDKDDIQRRLAALEQGFPNYFGEQRFGRQGGNIAAVQAWFEGGKAPPKALRGIYLSSARAQIFNALLAQRVADGSWARALDGELFCLRDSGSVFAAEVDAEIQARLQSGDIHISGPLFGAAGKLSVTGDVAALESSVFERNTLLCKGLLRHGLKMERRPLRVVPRQLAAQWLADDCVQLRFALPGGCFATSLVRELVRYWPAAADENHR